jgi:hypothetical protein
VSESVSPSTKMTIAPKIVLVCRCVDGLFVMDEIIMNDGAESGLVRTCISTCFY